MMNMLNVLAVSENMCKDSTVLKLFLFMKNVMQVVAVIVPIVLIVLVIFDFAKNVISNDEKDIRKNLQTAIKRVVYAVIIFFIPTLVNLIITIVVTDEYQPCFSVTKAVIEAQIKKDKAACTGSGYEWDESIERCVKKGKPISSSGSTTFSIPKINSADLRKPSKSSSSSSSSTKVKNLVYYNQGDYRNVPFCDDDNTVQNSGCGATSLAVMAASFGKSSYTPKTMANWLCNNGHGGGALPVSFFTKQSLLNHFGLSASKLFDNGSYQGNSGTKYDSKDGNKIFDAVKKGKGIILYVPGHYLAVGPNKSCGDNEVYLYDVGKRANLGCYTMKSLFKNTYNYKNRCSNNGNCGWKAAWVYTSK